MFIKGGKKKITLVLLTAIFALSFFVGILGIFLNKASASATQLGYTMEGSTVRLTTLLPGTRVSNIDTIPGVGFSCSIYKNNDFFYSSYILCKWNAVKGANDNIQVSYELRAREYVIEDKGFTCATTPNVAAATLGVTKSPAYIPISNLLESNPECIDLNQYKNDYVSLDAWTGAVGAITSDILAPDSPDTNWFIPGITTTDESGMSAALFGVNSTTATIQRLSLQPTITSAQYQQSLDTMLQLNQYTGDLLAIADKYGDKMGAEWQAKVHRISEETLTQSGNLLKLIAARRTATETGEAQGLKDEALAAFVAADQNVISTAASYDTSNAAAQSAAAADEAAARAEFKDLANDKGECSGEKYRDISQLMKPLPGGIMCFAEQGILSFLESIFKEIGALFKDVLLVNTNSAGGGTLLSANKVVIAVSNIFITFINSLFFIVALLSILVTTLKIDLPALSLNSWQLKRMIPTIITTMILVNYSLSVANLVIGIMDSLVVYFSSSNPGDISGFFNFDATMWEVKNIAWGIIGFRIIFLFVFLFVVLYLLCVLWVRKIVLIVLYMFAPVPYLANIIPVEAIKKQTGAWWGQFMNWGLMGPMVAVFLYAAAASIKVSFDAVPLPSSVTGSVPSGGGLDFNNMVLVSVLLYMAATVPLKLGGAVMAAVQKQTTAKAGKAAGAVGKSMKEGAVKAGKTAAYRVAGSDSKLAKYSGMKGLVGGAITAGRMPGMFKAKADKKLGAAKAAADDALDKGNITQRMKANPLSKEDTDKATDKNMTLAPQQVMDNALKAMKDGDKDKMAGAFKALQSQSKSLDPKVSQAAKEQITQLKNAGVIDLSDPNTKIDTKTMKDVVDWAKKSVNAPAMANLKRGFLKGTNDQVTSDLAGATAADTTRLAGLDSGLSDMEMSNLESKKLPELTYDNSDAGIGDQITSAGLSAGRTPTQVNAAAGHLAAGDTALAAAALGIPPTDTVNTKVLDGLQNKVNESKLAMANVADIVRKRTAEIVAREDKTVQGFLDDAGTAGTATAAARIQRHTDMEKELKNIEKFMRKGETEKAQRLANSVFMMGKADPLTVTQEEITKRVNARKLALSTHT
jgi:hypothetical protein